MSLLQIVMFLWYGRIILEACQVNVYTVDSFSRVYSFCSLTSCLLAIMSLSSPVNYSVTEARRWASFLYFLSSNIVPVFCGLFSRSLKLSNSDWKRTNYSVIYATYAMSVQLLDLRIMEWPGLEQTSKMIDLCSGQGHLWLGMIA